MVRRRKSGLNFGRRKKKINFAVVKEVLSWTVEIALTLLIAFTFVYFIGLRTSVVGQSMSKTLNGGDQILVCLLYTSDAADEEDSGDLGGRRIIKKKKKYRRNTSRRTTM